MFDASQPKIAELLEPLRRSPQASAVLTDVDGTLAPIVDRSADAEVPDRTGQALGRLAGRYALVGAVSGRPAAEIREMIGVADLTYSGNHGFELLEPGEDVPRPAPGVEAGAGAVNDFAGDLDDERLAAAEMRREDKGPIQALHWRGAEDEENSEAVADEIQEEAEDAGLGTHRGRKVLEVRPDLDLNKGTAITALLSARDDIDQALFAGDDLTDIDGFRALRELRDSSSLNHVVCVGIDSGEAPAELARESDLLVSGVAEFAELLDHLAAAH